MTFFTNSKSFYFYTQILNIKTSFCRINFSFIHWHLSSIKILTRQFIVYFNFLMTFGLLCPEVHAISTRSWIKLTQETQYGDIKERKFWEGLQQNKLVVIELKSTDHQLFMIDQGSQHQLTLGQRALFSKLHFSFIAVCIEISHEESLWRTIDPDTGKALTQGDIYHIQTDYTDSQYFLKWEKEIHSELGFKNKLKKNQYISHFQIDSHFATAYLSDKKVSFYRPSSELLNSSHQSIDSHLKTYHMGLNMSYYYLNKESLHRYWGWGLEYIFEHNQFRLYHKLRKNHFLVRNSFKYHFSAFSAGTFFLSSHIATGLSLIQDSYKNKHFTSVSSLSVQWGYIFNAAFHLSLMGTVFYHPNKIKSDHPIESVYFKKTDKLRYLGGLAIGYLF
jgi:hypothetical protein